MIAPCPTFPYYPVHLWVTCRQRYAPEDCYKKIDPDDALSEIHPDYNSLLRQYPFQQVTTQSGKQVNIILVRSPFRSKTQRVR